MFIYVLILFWILWHIRLLKFKKKYFGNDVWISGQFTFHLTVWSAVVATPKDYIALPTAFRWQRIAKKLAIKRLGGDLTTLIFTISNVQFPRAWSRTVYFNMGAPYTCYMYKMLLCSIRNAYQQSRPLVDLHLIFENFVSLVEVRLFWEGHKNMTKSPNWFDVF